MNAALDINSTGLKAIKSRHDVQTTTDRLEEILKEK